MTASFYEQTGISVITSTPLVWASRTLPDEILTRQLNDYSHTIAALGGYESADVTITDDWLDIEGWLDTGLARHVEVHNAALSKVWEGFVNEVEINVGSLRVTRGPLIEVCNRISVVYGNLDTTQNPPIQSQYLQTAATEDTDSQADWGEWEKVLSAGQTTAVVAQNIQDVYLNEYAEPQVSQTLSLTGQGNEPSVTLRCRGYQDWLDAGIYNQIVNSGTTQLETKLVAILDDAGADPNGLFASTNADIFASGILVPQYENENLKPRALLNAMTAMGDGTAADGQTLWGIYNDRRFVYAQIPTSEEYVWRLSDATQRIESAGGALVEPWDVRAGEWVFFPDFFIGRGAASSMTFDPRYLFIERVNYRTPYGVTLNGGKVGTLAQVLARYGLGGIG